MACVYSTSSCSSSRRNHSKTKWSPPSWDPEPLPPNWWEPLKSAAPAPDCSCPAGVVRISGSDGQTNNILIQLAHALAFAVAHTPPLMVDLRNMGHIGEFFDLRGATRGWACVALDQTDLMHNCTLPIQREFAAQDVFHAQENPVAGQSFRANVLQQILLRPSERLRKAVNAFEQQHGLANGFTAVHLRSLEHECELRVKAQFDLSDDVQVPKYIQFLLHEKMDAIDVCSMSNRYLDAIVSHAMVKHLPIVVAHDRQQPSRLADISRTYRGVSYQGVNGVFVDMLLLMRASYMIGNPASSMSGNAASVRSLLGLKTNLGDPMQWFPLFMRHQMGGWTAAESVLQRFTLHRRRCETVCTEGELACGMMYFILSKQLDFLALSSTHAPRAISAAARCDAVCTSDTGLFHDAGRNAPCSTCALQQKTQGETCTFSTFSFFSKRSALSKRTRTPGHYHTEPY